MKQNHELMLKVVQDGRSSEKKKRHTQSMTSVSELKDEFEDRLQQKDIQL
jgi:hypothetical protein